MYTVSSPATAAAAAAEEAEKQTVHVFTSLFICVLVVSRCPEGHKFHQVLEVPHSRAHPAGPSVDRTMNIIVLICKEGGKAVHKNMRRSLPFAWSPPRIRSYSRGGRFSFADYVVIGEGTWEGRGERFRLPPRGSGALSMTILWRLSSIHTHT